MYLIILKLHHMHFNPVIISFHISSKLQINLIIRYTATGDSLTCFNEDSNIPFEQKKHFVMKKNTACCLIRYLFKIYSILIFFFPKCIYCRKLGRKEEERAEKEVEKQKGREEEGIKRGWEK